MGDHGPKHNMKKTIKGLSLRSRPQCLRMHRSRSQYLRILNLSGSQYLRMCVPCLSACVCFSMPQCMRMQFLGRSTYVYHSESHFEFTKLCYHFRFEGL